jgi:hypothetical protein
MKRALLERYGVPEEGVRCADVPDWVLPARGKSCSTCSRFPSTIEDIKMAVAHAQRGERTGKIRVAPNGAV